MNEDEETQNHAQHPEELLAAYVSGEASDDDMATVQTLLSACSECRMEVDMAVQARAALQSLPDLEAPALRLDGVVRPTPAGTRERVPAAGSGILDKIREWGWERIAWGAGLVAAGSLVALFLLVQIGGGPLQEQAARAPQGGAASDRALTGSSAGPNYTPASLDALAKRLVASDRSTLGLAKKGPGPAAGSQESAEPVAGRAEGARECLRRGGGLSKRARPVHVEEAKFRGTPAFVGAFESGAPGGRQYLLVLAVDRRTCDALYVINRSL
ncbi:MAG TPA: hypothetical protein VHH54_02535 [Actinomycetota bacterium]|nr:hypothetical protein [Actinomycetota bacterium]